MKTGTQLIAEKRSRHALKGYDDKHDDNHTYNELIFAAKAYLYQSIALQSDWIKDPRVIERGLHIPTPSDYPWEDWYPSLDPIDNLAEAGAFIAAEIDRLNRLKAKNNANQ